MSWNTNGAKAILVWSREGHDERVVDGAQIFEADIWDRVHLELSEPETTGSDRVTATSPSAASRLGSTSITSLLDRFHPGKTSTALSHLERKGFLKGFVSCASNSHPL
jgi:hypothetical protein